MNTSLDNISCSICLSNEINNRGILNCCDHEFCLDCIIEWTKVESNCPLCKSLIKTITSSKTPNKKGRNKKNKVIKITKKIQRYTHHDNENHNILDEYYNEEEEDSDDSEYFPGDDLDLDNGYFQGEREFDIYNDDLFSDEIINIGYSRRSLENNLLNAVYGSMNRSTSLNGPRNSISNLVSSDDDDVQFCQNLPITPPERQLRNSNSRRERRGMSLFAQSDNNSSSQNNTYNQSSSSSSCFSNNHSRGNRQLVAARALNENISQPITLINSRISRSSCNETVILLSDSDDENNNNLISLSKSSVDENKLQSNNSRKRHGIIILSESEEDEKENLEENNKMDKIEINKSNSNSSQEPIIFSFTNHIQNSPIQDNLKPCIPLRQRLKDKKNKENIINIQNSPIQDNLIPCIPLRQRLKDKKTKKI